jgi:hypothetical protein
MARPCLMAGTPLRHTAFTAPRGPPPHAQNPPQPALSRRNGREIFELIDQHFERALFPVLRRDLERRVAILCRGTKQGRDQRRGLFELARAAR